MSTFDPEPGYETPPGVSVFVLRRHWKVWQAARFKGSTFCFAGKLERLGFLEVVVEIVAAEPKK